jgi:phage terminase small subunit
MPELSDQTPLDYLLSVMRNPRIDTKLRIQSASIAAPYMHGKVTEPGKREGRRQAAAKLGEAPGSRFAASAPPKLVAAGGKKV